jgi:hypothetical protein
MNDLDRKIAELKRVPLETGMYRTPGEIIPGRGFVPSGPAVEELPPLWSTSDAKALELADEAMDGVFEFCVTGTNYTDRDVNWFAWFALLGGKTARGEGRTRPEAICRAYIAAREWIKEKKA